MVFDHDEEVAGEQDLAGASVARGSCFLEGEYPMLNASYEKDPSMVSRRIADEVVLVPISRKVGEIDCLYALNEVGARVWDLIDRRSLKEVRDTIVEEFEVREEQAQEDLIELIEQLKEIGAIKEVS